jgi:hypothetical protein
MDRFIIALFLINLTPLVLPFLRLLSKGIKKDASPFKKLTSPSPYQGEGDKGDGVFKQYQLSIPGTGKREHNWLTS